MSGGGAERALRIAFIAGSLGRGGAEKQLLYAVRALRQVGAQVRVFALTRGECYESELRRCGTELVWIGRHASPLVRIASLTREVRSFRPHIVQSSHFFTNIYVAVVGRLCGCVDVGAIRNDGQHEVQSNRFFASPLLKWPRELIANSYTAQGFAVARGMPAGRIHVVPNVIDLAQFDSELASGDVASDSGCIRVGLVARLVAAKRIDRFLRAVQIVRASMPNVRGVVIGDGPEASSLHQLAEDLGLLPEGVCFLGERTDVPSLLRSVDMLVLSSDHEGFPNVLLEAMAARLPVVTTPAGDCGRVVVDGVTGYVVPPDERQIAERIIELATAPSLRSAMGQEGRKRVETYYSYESLPSQLLTVYGCIARSLGDAALRRTLDAVGGDGNRARV